MRRFALLWPALLLPLAACNDGGRADEVGDEAIESSGGPESTSESASESSSSQGETDATSTTDETGGMAWPVA